MRRFGFLVGAAVIAVSALAAAPAAAFEPGCGEGELDSLLAEDCPTGTPSRTAEAEGVDRLKKTVDRKTYQPGDVITFTIAIAASETGTETDNFHVYDRLDDVLDDAEYNDDAVTSRGTVELRQSGEYRELKWEGWLEPGGTATMTFSVTANADGNLKIRNFALFAAHSEDLPCAFKRTGDPEALRPGAVDFDALADQCKVTVLPEGEAVPSEQVTAEPVADDRLPTTGQSLGLLIAAAAGLVLIGAVLLVLSRRRRARSAGTE